MKKTINCKGNTIDLSKPLVMGILNVTPDSFYDGNKYNSETSIIERIEQMIFEGASIIDIGAYSSRPGSENISQETELERLIPALKIVSKRFSNSIISVDTFSSEIAKIAVEEYGVSIINDISGGETDKNMFKTVAQLNVPYILMHIKGNPQNMQNNTFYKDIIKEMALYFSEKINIAQQHGINDLILDPGFGFAKTLKDNYTLLNQLDKFQIFELPVLVGLSRKSMIYKALNFTPDDSLCATSALNMVAIRKGANILRVHDVNEAVQIIKLNELLSN